MMNNPFENDEYTYFVLTNDEGQCSIWPAFLDVPSGWSVVYGETSRRQCLDYIDLRWNDMRPNSLKSAMHIKKEF